MNKKAMYTISYGLFVVTACRGGKDNGCITNTVIQLTSEPNRISVAVNKSNYTCEMIRETGRFTASVIAQDATFDLFKRFGFQSGRDVDKFDGFDSYYRSQNGTLIITEGTNAWISAEHEHDRRCSVRNVHLLSGKDQTKARGGRKNGGGENRLALQDLRIRVCGGGTAGRLHLPDLQASSVRL